MGKIKIKKNDVWIDMTPMSDVMVLLLTFFMLSANFVKNEVVKVVTPGSTTMAKVPMTATLDITIDSLGRVFLGTDKTITLDNAYKEMVKECNIDTASINADMKKDFLTQTQVGIPMKQLASFLSKNHSEQAQLLLTFDNREILDSIQSREDKMSEFQLWVKSLKKGYRKWYDDPDVSEEAKAGAPSKLEICIKASKDTPYSSIKTVINELQDINESRYKLVTQYKKDE